MPETTWSTPVGKGDSGAGVRRAQEWLTLHDISIVVDGQFGPATETAVRLFQQRKALPQSGVVDQATFGAFVAPITLALQPIAPTASLGADVSACAHQHVSQKPREVGGQNRGPWVR